MLIDDIIIIMHDYVAGTDRARQRHQVADFGDILPPCRPPRVHLALSTKFQNLQFPPALSYLVSIPTEVGISFLLKFNRYIFPFCKDVIIIPSNDNFEIA